MIFEAFEATSLLEMRMMNARLRLALARSAVSSNLSAETRASFRESRQIATRSCNQHHQLNFFIRKAGSLCQANHMP